MELEQFEVPPVYLPVGTEVSAKFKGAFCEARITKLAKLVKIKVLLRDSNTITVDEAAIQGGRMEINQHVDVVHMKQIQKGQIICIKDCSSYTVIFNDGDERILKRTQLCQKGGKHFKDAETLDKLPLYHPDKRSKKKKEENEINSLSLIVSPNSQRSPRHFRSSSVTPLKGIASTRSATRAIARLQFEETERSASAAADCPLIGCMSDLLTKSNSLSPHRTTNSDSENEEMILCDQQQSTSTSATTDFVDEKPKAQAANILSKEFPPGVAVIVNAFTSPKHTGRVQLGLIVSHEEFNNHCKTSISLLQTEPNQVPFRSFQNGRYILTTFDRLRKFDPVETQNLIDFGSMGLKVAFERANNYVSRGEFPQSWTKKTNSVDAPKKKKKAVKVSESSTSEDDDSEYNERRDLCVAHFYKFQDESGNQLTKVPLLGGKEIDIYRFYDVVSRMGGHKRVTQESSWRKVLRKLHLEETGVSPSTVKNSYIRYFEKFEAFMKNLGYSSLTVASSAPSTNSRNTRMIRGYIPNESKLTEQKKKGRPKERKSLERGQSISKETCDNAIIKSRSRSITSTKAASPLEAIVATTIEQQQHLVAKPSPGANSVDTLISIGANNNTNFGEYQERIVLNEKVDVSNKATEKSNLLEQMEIAKKRTDSQGPTSESRSTSTEGSPTTTNKKETGEETNRLPKKQQSIRGRKPKIPRDQRTKSPSGHQAVLEDIGYTNAHIFTRFYQGQNVHARHHLRFYDARVIMVKQQSLAEIATSLCDAFDFSIISKQNLCDLKYENVGAELNKALQDIMMSTKIFVHYLGWNSRYDEWLMLHKIRVDEKDEKSSMNALERLIPDQLPAALVAVAMDWCLSAGGIASLAALPGAQSSEQRPRRLSTATLAKTNTNLVRKSNEVMSAVEPPDKQFKQQQQSSFQIMTSTNVMPQEIGFRSSAVNYLYSAPPLPPPNVIAHHQQPNVEISDLVISSSSSPSCASSPHIVASSFSEVTNTDQHLSPSSNPGIMSIKNDSHSVGRAPFIPMAPYSIVVKTAPTSEYAKCSSAYKADVLTSLKPMDEERSAIKLNNAVLEPALLQVASNCQPSPRELIVEIQADFAKVTNFYLQAETTVFVNKAFECCEFSTKVCQNYERKVDALHQQQHFPHVAVSSELSDETVSRTTLDKEDTKGDNVQQLQQVQNTSSNKKRTAAIGAMSPPTKIFKQSNKSAVRGGKTSTDTLTETSEDDEGTEGTHSVSTQLLRQRILQRMEDEHLFDSYSFVGLSELDEDLAKCADDADEQVRLIEGRMCELREIYHKYKGKLADLEKEHKKRQRQEKKNGGKKQLAKCGNEQLILGMNVTSQ